MPIRLPPLLTPTTPPAHVVVPTSRSTFRGVDCLVGTCEGDSPSSAGNEPRAQTHRNVVLEKPESAVCSGKKRMVSLSE